jgi:hypothetical protein
MLVGSRGTGSESPFTAEATPVSGEISGRGDGGSKLLERVRRWTRLPRDVLTVPEFVSSLLTALAEDEHFTDVEALCDLLPPDVRDATSGAVDQLMRPTSCFRFLFFGQGPTPEVIGRMHARLRVLAPTMAKYLAKNNSPQ